MSTSHHDHAPHCQELLERLSMYLDDELTADDRHQLEAHLHDCKCCDEMLEGLKHTVEICHDGKPALPADVQGRARARVEELLSKAASQSRSRTNPHA